MNTDQTAEIRHCFIVCDTLFPVMLHIYWKDGRNILVCFSL